MKLLSIRLRSFKPFHELQLPDDGSDLPTGLILVRGSNSTGKSSLFEAILWGLWGADAVKLDNDELVSFGSASCEVTLVFEVQGIQYKIHRSYGLDKRMSVTLFTKSKAQWKPIADKSGSVASKLEEILNLQLKQALNTLLVRQGEVATIASATPSDLRDLLVKVYNIELLDQMENHLENLETDVTDKVEALGQEYEAPERVEERVEKASRRIAELEERLAAKNRQKAALESQIEALPKADVLSEMLEITSDIEEKDREYEHAVSARDKELASAGLADSEDVVVRARQDLLTRELERLTEQRSRTQFEVTAADQEIGGLSRVDKDLLKQVETLQGATESGVEGMKCPTCSKPLSLKERDQILADYRKTLNHDASRRDELTKQKARLAAAMRTIDERLIAILRAIDALKRLSERQVEVDGAKVASKESRRKLESFLSSLGISNLEVLLSKFNARSPDELQRIVDRVNDQLEPLREEIDTIQKDINGEREDMGELESKVVRMRELGAEIAGMKKLVEHTKYVRRNLVKGFISDYVVQKRLIGIIRAATNQYVQSFTNGQYTRVDLEPTPGMAKYGAGLVLKIHDHRDNADKKASQLSYGDRTAVSLALRLGISRTMSRIRPLKDSPAYSPRVQCVLLDEPLGGLDKERRASVVENLTSDQSFKQIFLITHTDVPNLQGVSVIEVTKSGTGSTATLHAVP